MDDFLKALESIPPATANDGDYLVGGLLYCGKCHTPKEIRVTYGEKMIQGHVRCSCEEEAFQKREALEKEQKRLAWIEHLRADALPYNLRKSTFANDKGVNPEIMNIAKRYADNWEKMAEEKAGMLLWGGIGNGKTYAAACIANYLIDRGIYVKMISFGQILSMDINERGPFIEKLSRHELLIIDDLGSERKNPYAFEIVRQVIDDRYTLGKPLIVTTNLSLDAIRTADTIEYQRIYDRITEMCVPVQFKAESLRRKIADDKLVELKAILRGGDGK